MIPFAALALGITLGYACGGRLNNLRNARLRGEAWLVGILAAQLVANLVPSGSWYGNIVYWCWMAALPAMILIAAMNRAEPGMIVLATGLALNAAVSLANAGMPVSMSAGGFMGVDPEIVGAPAGVFHITQAEGSVLVALADVLPLPGPPTLRALVSAGDILLLCGMVSYVAGRMSTRDSSVRHGYRLGQVQGQLPTSCRRVLIDGE